MAVTFVLALGACGGSDSGNSNSSTPVQSNSNTPTPAQKVSATTLMIYMVGSDLESKGGAATANLNQLLSVAKSDDVNVVITTGAANKAVATDPVTDWRTVRRYELRNRKLQLITDLGKADMTDPGTLSDFIVWAKKSYPAQNYRLIMWDHGGGHTGFGTDENFDPTKSMSLPTMQAALKSAQDRSQIHFDWIGFDACLMATAEVANALAPYADYMIASQELEPGSGWDYATILSTVSQDPEMNGLQLGRAIVDRFMAYNKEQGDKTRAEGEMNNDDGFVTLSLIDLSTSEDLTESLNEFSTALTNYVQQSTDNWVRVARDRALTNSFGGDSSDQSGRFDLTDLATFAERLAADNIVPSESRLLASMARRAIIYRGNGALAAKTSGLSFYFPSRKIDTTTLDTVYAGLDFPEKYKAFLKTYIADGKLKPSVIDIDTSRTSGTTLSAVVNSSFGIAGASVIRSKPSQTPGVMHVTASLPVILSDNSYGDVSTKVNAWYMLNRHPVVLNLLETTTTEDGTTVRTFGIGAYVNGNPTTLVFQQNANTWVFVGTWDSTGALAQRMGSSVQPTDDISLITYDYNLATQTFVEAPVAGESFKAEKLALDMADMPIGSDQLNLRITDFAQESKMSSPLPVSF